MDIKVFRYIKQAGIQFVFRFKILYFNKEYLHWISHSEGSFIHEKRKTNSNL